MSGRVRFRTALEPRILGKLLGGSAVLQAFERLSRVVVAAVCIQRPEAVSLDPALLEHIDCFLPMRLAEFKNDPERAGDVPRLSSRVLLDFFISRYVTHVVLQES